MPLAAACSLDHKTKTWPGSNAGSSTTGVAGGGLNEGAENVGGVPAVGTCATAGTIGVVEPAGTVDAADAGSTGDESAAGGANGATGETGAAGLGAALAAGGAARGEPWAAVAVTGSVIVKTGRAAAGLGIFSEGRATGAVFVDPVGVDADGVNAGIGVPLVTGKTGAIGAFPCALAGVAVVAVTAPARFVNNASIAALSRSRAHAGALRWRHISVAPTPRPGPRHVAVPP